jgi:hypothetical protein
MINGAFASAQVKTSEPMVDGREARETSDNAYLNPVQTSTAKHPPVVAASAEIHGEHIALLDSKGNRLLCS